MRWPSNSKVVVVSACCIAQAAFSSEVHSGQRVAPTGIGILQ